MIVWLKNLFKDPDPIEFITLTPKNKRTLRCVWKAGEELQKGVGPSPEDCDIIRKGRKLK